MATLTPTTSPAIITPKLANGVIVNANQTIAGLDSRLNASAYAPAASSGVDPKTGLMTQKQPATTQVNTSNATPGNLAPPPQQPSSTSPTGGTTYWQIPGGAQVVLQPGQTPPAGSTQTDVSGTPTGTAPTTPVDPNQDKINKYQAGINDDTQLLTSARNSLMSIINGTYQLNADEQAQVNNLQNQFNQLEDEQRQANKAYEGGITMQEQRMGRGQGVVASSMGNIKGAIDEGIAKIASIESKAASAVSELREALKDKDYKRISDLYALVNDSMKQKTAAIKQINDDVRQVRLDAAKEEQDKITNQLNSDRFDLDQKKAIFDQAMANARFDFDQKKEIKDNWFKQQDLNLKAQANARANTTEKFKDYQLAGGQAGTGMSYAQFLMSGSGKPPTADESKNAGYALRMKEADNTLKLLTKQFTSLPITGQFYQSKAPSFLMSSDNQQMDQAKRDFLNAVLRRESGAVISPTEFESGNKQYFPQPGDLPAVIDQKALNRRNSLTGIVNSSGTGLSDDFKKAVESNKTNYTSLKQFKELEPDRYTKDIVPVIEAEDLTEAEALELINKLQ